MPLEVPTAVEATAYHQLEWLDYTMIGAYFAGALWMAWIFSRRQHSAEEYFLGGRRMPWFAVGLSLMATLTSTVSYLATPGEVIKYGLMGAMGGLLFYPLIYLVIAYGLIPVFLRLQVTSIYEYLEQRFDVRTRMFASAIFSGGSSELDGAGAFFLDHGALAQITQVDRLLILAGIGLIAVAYTTLGGMRAVIWTDVAQFFILFGGALFTVAYVVAETGTGPGAWWQAISAADRPSQLYFQLRPLRTGHAGGDGSAGLLLVRLHLRRRPGGRPAADVHGFGKRGPAVQRLRPDFRPAGLPWPWRRWAWLSIPTTRANLRLTPTRPSPTSFARNSPADWRGWWWRPCSAPPCPAWTRE